MPAALETITDAELEALRKEGVEHAERLGLPELLRGGSGPFRTLLVGALALSLLLMVTTGYYVAAVKPRNAVIIPSALFYLPPLQPQRP